MKFEILSMRHLRPLLEFELNNRTWFESMIAPRAESFYSVLGVQQQIEDMLEGMSSNFLFAGVLMNDSAVVARANLKDISGGTAYVGYRVAESFLSKGLASRCLTELILKSQELGIQTLKAQVLDNNPASARVLEKQGFEVLETINDFCQHNGQLHHCTVYIKLLKRN
jgi:ribosomal-protein-alanine N-acetyltransferase